MVAPHLRIVRAVWCYIVVILHDRMGGINCETTHTTHHTTGSAVPTKSVTNPMESSTPSPPPPTTQIRMDSTNTWTSIPLMSNAFFASYCNPVGFVNDMHQSEIWYYACSSQVGLVRYSLLTNTSEPMLAPQVNTTLTSVPILNQDSDGRLWMVVQLLSNEYACGYIATPLTASPENNSTVTWIPQPTWMSYPWAINSLAAHRDLVFLSLIPTGSPSDPTVIRVNLPDIDDSVMVFNASVCSTFDARLGYDWYLDSFLTICDDNGAVVGVVAIPYEAASPPYLLIPQTIDMSPNDVLRVNSGELFISFGTNTTACVMVWSNSSGPFRMSDAAVTTNCDPHSCPSVSTWSYSQSTDTILITCELLPSGFGAIVAIQPTQGELNVENAANIQSTILAAACGDINGPQFAVIEPLSPGVAVLCDDGAQLFRGQAISILVSSPTCNKVDGVQADPSTNMVFIACDGDLLVIDGGVSSQRKFSACSHTVSSITHSPGSQRTYSTTVDQITSNIAVCVIQPITHEMMLHNIGPSSHLLLEFNLTVAFPTLLMANDHLLCIIIIDYGFVFLHELTNSTTTIPTPNPCGYVSAVSMNGFLYALCSWTNSTLYRLDLSNFAGGWVVVLTLSESTCPVMGTTISARPLTNQLYIPCIPTNFLNLLVINCTTFTTNQITLMTNVTFSSFHTMVDPTSSYVFLFTNALFAPYPLITYDETIKSVMPNTFINQPCNGVHEMEVDPTTGTIYLRCQNNDLFVLSKGFKCHEGYEWTQNQQCQTCTIGSAKGPIGANATYAPQCQICEPGTIAVQPGSAICQHCPIGRFQDINLAQQVCSYCQPGKYQNDTSQTICLVCPPGQFTSDVGFTQCANCQPGRYTKSNTSTTCQLCDRGTASNLTGLFEPCPLCPAGSQQLQYGGTSCSTCDLGSFSQSGDECLLCPLNSYQPMIGEECVRCDGPNQIGLYCEAGLATVLPGYFAYPVYDPTVDQWIYATTACPPNYCPGSPLQVLNSTSMNGTDSSIQYCLYPRLNSPSNLLCASCEDGFILWGQSCVECTATNGPLLFGVIFFLFLLVGFLLRSGSESAGHLTILIYFLQISALELQQPVDTTNTRSINWLQVFNLSVLSLDTCFAPLTPLQQILLTYASPIILFLILLFIVGGHRLLHHFNLCRQRLGKAPLNSYIACTITILLFCYTSVTVMVVRTLNCVTIAPDVTVLWSQPSVDCSSEEYHRVFIVTMICLVIYTIGFPLVIFCFLFYRHRTANLRTSPTTPNSPSARSLSTIRSYPSWSPLTSIDHLDNDLRQPFQLPADPLAGSSNPPSISNDAPLRPSSPSSQLSDPSDSGMLLPSADGRTVLTQFDLRWGALYLEFGDHAWYWTSWILVRRFAFALVSVLITSNINLTFILFTVLNMISAFIHLWAQPFRSVVLNQVDTGAHLLLLTISFILNGSGASRPLVIQLLVLLLIIPPGLVFGVYTLKHHFILLRTKYRSKSNHFQLTPDDRFI